MPSGHTKAVTSVKLAPSELMLVSGSQDRIVRVWDMRSHIETHNLVGHTGLCRVYAVVASLL